jgi:4-amino-4-deoxy-L-arabinose transferase-like glycosyltransferase
VAARRLIVGIALAGCLVRAAFGLLYWHDKPLTHDEREYLSIAANLAAGRGFAQTLPGEVAEDAAEDATRRQDAATDAARGAAAPTVGGHAVPPALPEGPATPAISRVQQFGRAPLYPFFLAPLTLADADLRAGRLPADVPWAIKLAQAIVGGVGVWLIGLIAWRLAGDRAGAWAAGLAAIYPPLVWCAAFALSEVLYSTLALAGVWVLSGVLDGAGARGGDARTIEGASRGTRDGAPNRSAAAAATGEAWRTVFAGGLLVGLAILTRPAMLFFLPFALLLAWRRGPRLAAWLLGGVLLVVLPWTARNVATYGRFVLIASEGGVTFWTGNHPDAGGEGDLAANPHLKELNRAFRERHAELSEEALESVYYREAAGFIVSHPGSWSRLLAKKLFYTWVPIGPSYRLHSPRYFWASVLSYGAVLPFALLGVVRLWRSARPRPWTLWSLAGSALLVCVIFFPQERFRIPVVDPTLLICAAAWLARRDRLPRAGR